MKTPLQHRLAPCLALLALLAACGGDGTSGNVLPSLAFQAPIQDQEGPVGMVVDIRFTADDPVDEAMIDLYADRDGDPATTGDRHLIAKDIKESDGAPLSVRWNSAGVPAGEYHLMGVIRDGRNDVVQPRPARIMIRSVWPYDHGNIVLRDVVGDAIPAGSTVAYSPRQTCGTCHDVDEIANGYHFQQGRTDETGALQARSDFFADGRTWLQSDGMYGKW